MPLSDPDLVKALDVTKEQQDKMAAVGKEYDEKQRELFPRRTEGGNAGGSDFAAAREKMTALNKERETKVTDVLTAEQKAALRWDDQAAYLERAQLYPAPDAELDAAMQDVWTRFLAR